jgi:hypothetical protein
MTPVVGQVQIISSSVSGVDGKPIQSSAPLDIDLTFDSPIDATTMIFIGITQGTATPVLLVSDKRDIEQGKTRIRCRLSSLPIPEGTYYLWVSVGAMAGMRGQLLPWGPVAQFQVVGTILGVAPRGVVRLCPVFVVSEWDAE